ncbi:MAG: response regulator [Candidatus Wallbacteria bacterium]|nr:response regulator [Candidatus Wallbacteria bacterium]
MTLGTEVLIVEDSPTQALQLRFMLERHGFTVRLAENGRQALELVAGRRPQLVLSDMGMPLMDGCELSRRLKDEPGLAGIPVILLTSLAEPDDLIRALQSGADGFLAKPCNEQTLLSRIGRLLAAREQPRGELPQRFVMEVALADRVHSISVDRFQVVEMLFSTFEASLQLNARLIEKELQLEEALSELTAAKESAERANRAKTDFLSSISHELRTPLGAIIGFSQLLEEQSFGPLTTKQAEYVRDILESGDHLLSLVNELLDLGKLEAGRMELEPSRFAFAALLDDSLSILRGLCSRRRLELATRLDDEVAVLELTADRQRLKQVMFNLISNAVKFTPDGGRIAVTARREGGELLVSVADSGIGIAVTEQPRLFSEFYQVSRAGRGKPSGTGLGLALTKRLVELHGGRVWVQSEGEGRGSTFGFAVPLEGIGAGGTGRKEGAGD